MTARSSAPSPADGAGPRLVIAAHGTRDPAGLRTTVRIRDAAATVRPDLDVTLAYLDVVAPDLATVLDRRQGAATVVVPLLLGAGYHVLSDIPAVVAGRAGVRVSPHLGPDPLVVAAVADRLVEAVGGAVRGAVGGTAGGTVVLAAVGSSRPQAVDEFARAADGLARRLGRPVEAVTATGLHERLAAAAAPVRVAPYLLAPGEFLDRVRAALPPGGVVAEPIGDHPSLIALVLRRYDAATG